MLASLLLLLVPLLLKLSCCGCLGLVGMVIYVAVQTPATCRSAATNAKPTVCSCRTTIGG